MRQKGSLAARKGLQVGLLGLSLGLLVESDMAVAADHTYSGFVNTNIYPYMSDVDTGSSVTINVGASLPNRFSYFSLNSFGSKSGASGFHNLDRYYSEQNLRWQIQEQSPLDLTMQLNFRSGSDNDRYRFGVRWRLHDTELFESAFQAINFKYSVNFHLVQIDNEPGRVWQMEHVYRLTVPQLSERIYLSGFMDQTFNQRLPAGFPENPIVTETQLGVRLIDNLYAVAEYRLNQYRRSDVNDFVMGVEYKLRW